METRQNQKAGNNSQLIQAGTINNIGITEKRVREIFDELVPIALQNYYTNEANRQTVTRSTTFAEKTTTKFVEKGFLEAFSDPSFQFLLQEAIKRAAMTERERDYDLLSELMIHRFEKKDDRAARVGINRAVEIVDQISDDALLALTVIHSVSLFIIQADNLDQSLEKLDKFYSEIIYDKLPENFEWLDQLDILDAIRYSSGGIRKTLSLEDFWYNKLDGFLKFGINKKSDNYPKALSLLKSIDLNEDCFKKNHSEEYLNIGAMNKANIENLRRIHPNGKEEMITKKEQDVLEKVYDLYDEKKVDKKKFTSMIDQYKNLQVLRKWWNGLGDYFIQITSVGRVLAHSNAQRINPNLPPLD